MERPPHDLQIDSLVNLGNRLKGHAQPYSCLTLNQRVHRTGTRRGELVDVFRKSIEICEGLILAPGVHKAFQKVVTSARGTRVRHAH